MLVDARDVQPGTTLRGDVCVIGAGAAGITLARALGEAGRTVLLLESGGFEPEASTQALYEGERDGDPFIFNGSEVPLAAGRLRFFGGTTNHWGGLCRPLEADDFGAHAGAPAWPITASDLAPHYAGAQDVCQLGPPEYGPAFWSRLKGAETPSLGDEIETVVFQLSPPTRFGQAYRTGLVDSRDVTVCTHANATRLVLDDSGAALSAVEAATLEGSMLRAEARAYVLAAGGVEVPRLLLASNDRRSAGIGNEHDLVGRFFSDHIVYHGARAVVSESAMRSPLYASGQYTARVKGRARTVRAIGAIGLNPGARARHGLRAVVAFLVEPPGYERSPEPRGEVSAADVTALAGRVDGVPARRTVPLLVVAEPSASADNRVELSRERDALGQPRARVRWRPTTDDRENLQRSLETMATAFGRSGAGRMQVEHAGVGPLDAKLWVANHHMGTTRMHQDPASGVVDADCRVHAVANLYVAGSSVFTAPGYANPTLTIVALALRLAEHLRETVR